MRLCFPFFCFCLSLTAQIQEIQDLATTDDGQQTYFATAYRLKGSDEAGNLKIFRYVDSEFQRFRELKLVLPSDPDLNFYLAERPSISGDGRVVAYTASSTCIGGSHCLAFIYHQGWVAGLGGPDRNVSNGMLTLSPDGRYVLLFSRGGFPPYPDAWSDLTQSNVVALNGLSVIGDGRQALAGGGIALLSDEQGPLLWNQGNLQRLSFSETPINARLNKTAQTIVYEAASAGGGYELHSYDVATGHDLTIATAPPASTVVNYSFFHPALTNDGALVSYILDNQLMVEGTDGSGLRQLLSAPEGLTEAIISGFGNLAYAATTTSRLLRIDIASGVTTELSAAVPHIQIVGGALAPGARLDLSVSNVPANVSDPAILSNGPPAPVIARSASAVTLQIPWEAPVNSTVKLVVPANPSAFEEDNDGQFPAAAPVFYTLPLPPEIWPPYALAAHQDFSSLVTDSSPARPGEIVHLYFTGLGAVVPHIATGAVTPAGTLYRVQTPFSCQFQQGAQLLPARILFAGLAPGFIGVNQVDLQIPSGLTDTHPQINCVSSEPIGTSGGFAQIPVEP